MLAVKDLNEWGLLPEEFLELLPKECPTCFSPTIISETLTSLQCSNLRCPDKIVMRIKALLDSLGIKGLGEKTIATIVGPGYVTNPLEIMSLRLGDSVDGVGQKTADAVFAQIQTHSEKGFLLWEYVQLAQLPGIQTSAERLFKGYSSIDDFYSDLQGVSWVQDRLGIQGDDQGVSIFAINAYQTLIEFEEDLKEGLREGWVQLNQLGERRELKVVVSDSVEGGFKTKNEFYNYVRDNFPQYHVTFGPSVNRKIDALIWAGADGSPARYTSKVRTVEGYQDSGLDIPILTGRQFISALEDGVF